MATVMIPIGQRVRLYSLLRVDFCIMYAQSGAGKVDALEDLVTHVEEMAVAAIAKARSTK